MDSPILTPLIAIQPSLRVGDSPINLVGMFIYLFTEYLYNPGAGGEESGYKHER